MRESFELLSLMEKSLWWVYTRYRTRCDNDIVLNDKLSSISVTTHKHYWRGWVSPLCVCWASRGCDTIISSTTQWKWNSRLNRVMKSFLWPDVLHLSTKHCWLAIWKDSKSEFISQNRWEWQSLADCHSCCSTRVSSHLHTHIGINSINRICGWNVFPITTLSRSLLCTHAHIFAPCSHVLTATTCRWCRQCWSLERAASCTSQ